MFELSLNSSNFVRIRFKIERVLNITQFKIYSNLARDLMSFEHICSSSKLFELNLNRFDYKVKNNSFKKMKKVWIKHTSMFIT